ncbi:arsenate reductase family protein [Alistipes indistinctus]|jgi:arsenate reductase|uniref:arsenate reductase family protein n=1 Tax=Alistipes indistinctus TaxID=626932 RepID=UPI00242BCE74|nr:arsenate reductase family protein [Alistipes indistinctus]
MKPLFIQYAKCGTCIKARKWLEAHNIAFDTRDIITQNPTEPELGSWLRDSSLPVQKFFNTSGLKYKELNLKDKVKTTPKDQLLALLASDGKLVKRPVLVLSDRVLVGFKEEEWAKTLL